ncbi:unnamed protein product, partial [Didymodactylos carnosus]
IQKLVLALDDYMGVTCHACIDGKNVCDDIKQLEAGVQVVVGTPGRVYDMLTRSALCSKNIKMFVLDEADEILFLGFKEQIYGIFTMMPGNVQAILLSATMPSDEWKLDTLCDLYETLTITHAVIFCNTCQKIDWLTEKLGARNFTVSAMEHNVIMKKFRTGSSRVLIRTDLLGCNTDIQQVGFVVNYDLPNNRENNIHRIRRSGAFGRKGVAINFVTDDDRQTLRHIVQFYNTQMEEMPMDIAV